MLLESTLISYYVIIPKFYYAVGFESAARGFYKMVLDTMATVIRLDHFLSKFNLFIKEVSRV